jgi:hypothetical protein
MVERSYFPRKIDQHVTGMHYVAALNDGDYFANLGSPPALSVTNIASAQHLVSTTGTTVDLTSFTLTDGKLVDSDYPYGAAVAFSAVGSVTNARTLTVKGRDYLGAPMTETIGFTGTNQVVGKKAFKYLDSITPNAGAAFSSTDLYWQMGISTKLGLPYKTRAIGKVLADNVAVTGNGTFTAPGVTTQTATTADTRGTYTATNADGTINHKVQLFVDPDNLHGISQFYA